MSTCKVKDFLKSIEYLRKKYPDIDDYDLYTEVIEYIGPERNVSIDEAVKKIDNCKYDIIYYKEDECWVVVAPERLYYYPTEKEARESITHLKECYEEEKHQYLKTKDFMESRTKNGWKTWLDAAGILHLEVSNDTCHYIADPENKRISINNNY